MTDKIQTAWMWRDEQTDSIAGVLIDIELGVLQWYDEPGCACAGSNAEQTVSDFLETGPRIARPPDDVLAEMRMALQSVL